MKYHKNLTGATQRKNAAKEELREELTMKKRISLLMVCMMVIVTMATA